MYKIFMDESGNVDDENQNYFNIGGVIVDDTYQSRIDSVFISFVHTALASYNYKELKSKKIRAKNELIISGLLSLAKYTKGIKTFVFSFDKKKLKILKEYDRKSFKYNKLLEIIINDFYRESIIEEGKTIKIFFDELTFGKYDNQNFNGYLPKIFNTISKVKMANSEKYNYIQIADLLAGILPLKNPLLSFKKNNIFKLYKLDLVKIGPQIFQS